MNRILLTALLIAFCHCCEAADNKLPVHPFLAQHCADCHSDSETQGGFNVTDAGTAFNDEKTFATWVRVFDRIDQNEMPPRDADQPKASEKKSFLGGLGRKLEAVHSAEKGTVLRRLNRQEYENTLNDIFGTNLDLVSRLPEDGRSHEFENVGKSLNLSMVQLNQYLESIDAVMDDAISKYTKPPKRESRKISYANGREAPKFIGKQWLKRPDGAIVFFRQFGYPTGMLRDSGVPQSGKYKVRVTGYAFQSDKPITFSVGGTTFKKGLEKPTYGYYSMPPGKPTTIELETWIESNYMIEILPWGIIDRDNQLRKNGIKNYKGPGLAILHVELDGPITDEFPTRGHNLIFDGLSRNEVIPSNKSQMNKSWYVPQFKVDLKNESSEISKALIRVATKAFRRPTQRTEIKPYQDLYNSEKKNGASVEEALRTAVAAIFCAPDFIYLKESQGKLNDLELANRLSYFLNRTTPDNQLLDSAVKGELTNNSANLKQQVDRLLEHEHFNRFVKDFTDSWLNLRDIEFTSPDQSLFPEYDQFLQNSMLDETRLYVKEIILKNHSIQNLVKSDFAMLNSRLAEHYGIDGVNHAEVQKVSLPSDSLRGGLLSQASILKVSANGTNTSPVVRGVWVTERILGVIPQPPPPGVAGVEPDIRGATTLRELLDKHRDSDNCRACHALIDPPGFALESFNPIGGFRENFRSLGKGEKLRLEVNGRRVRYRLGPKVDSTGKLLDGTSFQGYKDFRDHLAQNEKLLATSFTEKVLTFATGREMGFSDRKIIEEIVKESSKTGYNIRDLFHLIVQSEIFKSK